MTADTANEESGLTHPSQQEVETCARAMFEERRAKYRNWCDTWDDLTPMVQKDWCDSARICLSTLSLLRDGGEGDSCRADAREVIGLCPVCNGNDRNAPCAYPSERKPGCLRDRRLRLENEAVDAISETIFANVTLQVSSREAEEAVGRELARRIIVTLESLDWQPAPPLTASKASGPQPPQTSGEEGGT